MSINEQHFNKASELLERRRVENRKEEQKRHDEICAKIPEYAKLELLLADTSRKLIAIMLNKNDSAEQMLNQLEQSNLSLQKNLNALLVTGGFPEDYLDPIYTCTKCRDKGTLKGEWCDCFKRLMMNAAAEELNANTPLKLSGFDSFRLDLYSDKTDSSLGTSPRAIMEYNLNFCKEYAQEFTTEKDGIMMSGATGLGKTHLSLAIADTVMKKGYSVIYGSVPELLRTIEREYFGKSDDDTMSTLTKCDLLILDDIGAEMEKPLYASLLYELLNARLSRNLPIIINSNLSQNDLKKRYQDRIFSRLYSLEVLAFVGSDNRIALKKK